MVLWVIFFWNIIRFSAINFSHWNVKPSDCGIQLYLAFFFVLSLFPWSISRKKWKQEIVPHESFCSSYFNFFSWNDACIPRKYECYFLQILRRRAVFVAGASKGAVDQLTRMMALELGPHQVNFYVLFCFLIVFLCRGWTIWLESAVWLLSAFHVRQEILVNNERSSVMN